MLAKSNQFKRNTKGRINKEYENVHKIKETREYYFCHRKGHLAKDCRYAKQKKLKAKEKTEQKQNPETSEGLISEGFDFDKQDEDIIFWVGINSGDI